MAKLDARPLTFTALPLGIVLALVAFGAQLLGLGGSSATQASQHRLKTFAKCLEAAAAAKGGPPPLGEELHTLVVRCQTSADLVEDTWGTPFVIVRLESGFVVASCGPDLDCNTRDDLAAYGNWAGHELAHRAGVIPGWSTQRSSEGLATEFRGGLMWLSDNPWLGLCFIGIWGIVYGGERVQRRREPRPETAPAPEPKAAPARPAARSSPPAADAPMLDDVLEEEAAPAAEASAEGGEAAAPEGDMNVDLGFEEAAGEASGEAPPEDLDLMADDAPGEEAPPEDLSVDLGFEEPAAASTGTPRPPSLSGAYSISRGAREGESAPARLREEVVPRSPAQRRVPTRRPPGAGKPAAARSKPPADGGVQERFRDRGVVSETQRIQSHKDSLDPKKKP